jgi:sec-independent protein translocase protein TatA
MIGDLFDSPWKILIVAVVLIVLFGSAKLPGAARSLGKSMRILKTEVQGLHGDEESGSEAAPPAQPVAQQQLTAPQQVDDRPRQRAGLTEPSAGPPAPVPADQRTQQPS